MKNGFAVSCCFCMFIVFARICTCIFTTLPDLSFGFFMQVRPVLPQGASGGIQGVCRSYLGRKENIKGRGSCGSVGRRPEV